MSFKFNVGDKLRRGWSPLETVTIIGQGGCTSNCTGCNGGYKISENPTTWYCKLEDDYTVIETKKSFEF